MAANPWKSAVGKWLPLAKLLRTVEREFGVDQGQAASALRAKIETYEIRCRVPDTHNVFSPDLSASPERWVDAHRIEPEGWSHVVWGEGTIGGSQIQVEWSAVQDAIRSLIYSKQQEEAIEMYWERKRREHHQAALSPLRSDEAAVPPPAPGSVTILTPSDDASARTGAQGRPTSKHLLATELRRRANVGALSETLAEEALILSAWLANWYPKFPQMAQRGVQNCIRAEFKALKQTGIK